MNSRESFGESSAMSGAYKADNMSQKTSGNLPPVVGPVRAIGSVLMMLLCPLFALWLVIACNYSSGGLIAASKLLAQLIGALAHGNVEPIKDLIEAPLAALPASAASSSQPLKASGSLQLSLVNVIIAYTTWIAFQAVLYAILPGKIASGQPTPAGITLKYKVYPFGSSNICQISI